MPKAKSKSKSKSKSKCPKGQIYRKPYTRKVGSKTVKVKGDCITATSQSGQKRTDEFKKHQRKQARSHELARKAFPKAASKKCGSKQIKKEGYIRKGYTRKAYTRSDGTRVKAVKVPPTVVPPTCIKDVGKPGKGRQLFRLESDDLKPYGYENVKSLTKAQ